MDEYSGKRSVGRLVIPRKGSGLVLREAAESRDGNAQFCNRLGCNGRLNHTKSVQNGCSEKFRSSRPAFHASNSKEIIGSSTRTCSAVANTRKKFQESRKKLSSRLEIDSSETSSVQDEPEVSDVVPSPGRVKIGFQSALNDVESGKIRLMEAGSSSVASNRRPRNVFQQKTGMGTQATPPDSSIPLASKSTCLGAGSSASASRYGLRNLRRNLVSDVVASGSSSESNISGRKDLVKKRSPDVKSSSFLQGKKMSGPLLEDNRSSTSTHGISVSDSRRTRNWSPRTNNGARSVRTPRSINGNNRTRLSNQGNGNSLSPMELPVVTSQVPKPESPIAVDSPSSSHQFSAEASSSHSTSFSRPGRSYGSFPGIMPFCPTELGTTRSLMNRDGLRRYNVDGIAEVLLALERIEHDGELTYEQLLSLETNLFLGGLGFYDQHRDMRLDIDNMSYEELLALEEKMGNVSTALPEEALSKCLKRSIYQPKPSEGTVGCSGDEDDVKCSICQEEYAIGDEVGKLECEHGYHAECIHQWLQLKNWCPICKASAAAAAGSSESSLVS